MMDIVINMHNRIDCCRECKPPKRHAGCHDTCKIYIEQKQEYEDRKTKIRDAKSNERLVKDYIYERGAIADHNAYIKNKNKGKRLRGKSK